MNTWDDDIGIMHLRPLAHRNTRRLDGEDAAALDKILRQAQTIYQDPLRYEQFYAALLAAFPGTHKLGTVGARLVGCAEESVHRPLGCHALCAGALPLPREDEDINSHCRQMVVFAAPGDSGGLSINVLNIGTGLPARLYVDAPHFSGFDLAERERLEDLAPRYDIYLGLDAVRPAFRGRPASDLPHRRPVPHTMTVATALALVLFVVLLMLVLVLTVQISGRQNRISLPL